MTNALRLHAANARCVLGTPARAPDRAHHIVLPSHSAVTRLTGRLEGQPNPTFICARSETESAFEPEARPPLFPRGPTGIKGDGAILPNRGKHLVPSRKTLIFRFPAVPGGIPARPGRQPDYPSQAPAVGLRQGLAAPEQNRLTAETLVFSAGYPGPWPPTTTPSSCANAPTSCVKFSAASPTKRPSKCSRLRSPSWRARRR